MYLDDLKLHIIGDLLTKSYLVETPNGLFLIDTGASGNEPRIFRKMDQINRNDLKLIYITHAHFDHYGSAQALQQKTGAPIAVHRSDAGYMSRGETPLEKVRSWGRLGKRFLPIAKMFWSTKETEADILVEEGHSFESLGLNAVVLHMPGHTPGSTCLLLEGKYAFVGDLVISQPWLHVQNYYADNWDDVVRSFERLKKLSPRVVFPGHGRPINGDKLDKIKYDHMNR
ncbi:MAG: MBL fold metallo-hydrolase [Deltaproteobacteria bacterium]|nr:MBL fold metallo-hydrolase [Deltaproteobacteria bacterium]